MLPAPGRRLFALAVVTLVALHIWPLRSASAVVFFGWLPWDLAYHVGWMAVAAALVHWMAVAHWPDAPSAPRPPDGGDDE